LVYIYSILLCIINISYRCLCRLPIGKSVTEVNDWFLQHRSILAKKKTNPEEIAFHMLLNLDASEEVIEKLAICLKDNQIHTAQDLVLFKERIRLRQELMDVVSGSRTEGSKLSTSIGILFDAFPDIMQESEVFTHQGFLSSDVRVIQSTGDREALMNSILTSIKAKRVFTVNIRGAKVFKSIEMNVSLDPSTGESDAHPLMLGYKFETDTVHRNDEGVLMVHCDDFAQGIAGWVPITSLKEDLRVKSNSIEKFEEISRLKLEDLVQQTVKEVVPLVNITGIFLYTWLFPITEIKKMYVINLSLQNFRSITI